jgi:hypothetical protein
MLKKFARGLIKPFVTNPKNREKALDKLIKTPNIEEFFKNTIDGIWAKDKQFILTAIETKSPSVLKYASDELKADQEVVLAAVKQDGSLLNHASKKLQEDIEFIKILIEKSFNPACCIIIFKTWKGNKEIVLAAALDRFEFWDASTYKQLFEDFSADAFSNLAQEVMAGIKNQD